MVDQIRRQRRQPIVVPFRPAVFDRDLASLVYAGFAQALADGSGGPWRRNPITGIAGCCARAAPGQSIEGAAAAPASSDMNSRRLMSTMAFPASCRTTRSEHAPTTARGWFAAAQRTAERP